MPYDAWHEARKAHHARVDGWIADRQSRASRKAPNAVFDFLFTYYSLRPSHLGRWSPGFDVVLEGGAPEACDWPQDFVGCREGAVLPGRNFPPHRLRYLEWAIRYLSAVRERAPSFSCFGLHEWAMLYRTDDIRHSQTPLRVSKHQISSAVEELGLRCSHFDAFRFFTSEAAPLNKQRLSRESTTESDQRACIHVTMDLYKFAYKIAPWCPSDIVAEAFLLAADARTIDMRASPYDLSAMGLAPICIETAAGRQEYVQEQRRLSELSTPIRDRLLSVYELLGLCCAGDRSPPP